VQLNIVKSGGALTALRGFRLLKVFKLARGWKRLQSLLKTIYKTIKDMGYFSVLLAVFLFMFIILGCELFAYEAVFDGRNGPKDPEGDYVPQSTFNNFLDAFYCIIIVMANDGWAFIYFHQNRATNAHPKSYLYFLTLLPVCQWVLVNLFLAILLQNFDEQSLTDVLRQQFYDKKKQRLMLKKEAGQKVLNQDEGVFMRMVSKGIEAIDKAIR